MLAVDDVINRQPAEPFPFSFSSSSVMLVVIVVVDDDDDDDVGRDNKAWS